MTSLSVTSVNSVPAAIEQMTAISAALPPGDGVATFNTMYLSVTKAVAGAIQDGFFTNSAFLDRLDVVFANRYFLAFTRAEAGADIPHCWKVLWDHRAATHVAPIQFALAGMNAHINHDLALALIDTFTELDAGPGAAALHADFQRVNKLLGSLDGTIRRSFETGLILTIDKDLGTVPDCVDSWNITQARDAAWRDAGVLWEVRNHHTIRAGLERALDDAAAVAGACLLTPIEVHEAAECAACKGQSSALS